MVELQTLPLAGRSEAESPRSLIGTIDAWLGAAVEGVAAALVAAEIVILFAGVVARYVFNAPLVWSDELASILFVWLAMFGAALALERGEHMAMTALVSRLPARWQTWCRTVAAMLVCVFVGLIIVP